MMSAELATSAGVPVPVPAARALRMVLRSSAKRAGRQHVAAGLHLLGGSGDTACETLNPQVNGLSHSSAPHDSAAEPGIVQVSGGVTHLRAG